MLNALHRPAVLTGAVWCLAIAMPATILAAALDRDEDASPSNWIFLAFVAILVAYLFGGAQAGLRAPAAPFLNGAAAVVTAFLVVQVVFSVVNIAQGDGVNVVLLVFNVLLAASTGTVGAWFGARRAAAP